MPARRSKLMAPADGAERLTPGANPRVRDTSPAKYCAARAASRSPALTRRGVPGAIRKAPSAGVISAGSGITAPAAAGAGLARSAPGSVAQIATLANVANRQRLLVKPRRTL